MLGCDFARVVWILFSYYQRSKLPLHFCPDVRGKVHAVLVQLPLPSHIDEALILSKIRVDKVGLTSEC